MNIRKKLSLLLVALIFSVFESSATVSADTKIIDFIFTDTKTPLPTETGYKNDLDPCYYIRIGAGNPSSTNILGTRMHQGKSYVSNYEYHTSLHDYIPYNYTVTVSTQKLYYLSLKKDDTLTVAGSVIL